MDVIHLTQVIVGNEPSGTIKGGKLLDKLSVGFLVENDYSS
jgi:hypothetical protein